MISLIIFCVCYTCIFMDITQALSAKSRLSILEIKTADNVEEILQNSRRISDVNGTVMELGKCLLREHDEPYEMASLKGKVRTEDDTKDEYKERILTAFKQEKLHVRNHLQRMSEAFGGFKEDVMKTIEAETLALNHTAGTLASELDTFREELNKTINWSDKKHTGDIKSLISSLTTVSTEFTASDKKHKAAISALKSSVETMMNKLQDFDKRIYAIEGGKTCPDGWTNYFRHCYKVFSDWVNYDNARKTCDRYKAHVVDIQDEEEMNFVIGLVGTGKHFWLGLTDKETEDRWIWERTGAMAQYQNWRPGQPDSADGDQDCVCVGFQSPYDKWNDLGCHDETRVVCKK